MRRRLFATLVALGAFGAAACGRALSPPPSVPREAPMPGGAAVTLELVAMRVLATGEGLPGDEGLPVGGLSGCAVDPSTGRTLVVSDDRAEPRVFVLDVRADGDSLDLSVSSVIRISDPASGTARVVDMEGIAAPAPGDVVISSEGDAGGDEPMPPAMTRYDTRGAMTGWLEIPEAFLPDPPGAPTRGVHPNLALESLTQTPDGRLLTSSEGPLAQDGAVPGFDESAPVRFIEYQPAGDTWRPARQFAYVPSPVSLPEGFGPSRLATGVADLLALDDERVLVLERSFIAERDGARRGRNVVRIYEASLRDADDVSARRSLRDGTVRPLPKRLVLDLDTLAPRLARALPTLENFEAMCPGPRRPDGVATLLLISDNNLSRRQKTAFLLFRLVQ